MSVGEQPNGEEIAHGERIWFPVEHGGLARCVIEVLTDDLVRKTRLGVHARCFVQREYCTMDYGSAIVLYSVWTHRTQETILSD